LIVAFLDFISYIPLVFRLAKPILLTNTRNP